MSKALVAHVMKSHEGYEETAEILVRLIHQTALKCPGRLRYLSLDVDGHRNSEGGFDKQAWEVLHYLLPDVLAQFLTGYSTPFGAFEMKSSQREDPPSDIEFFANADAG